MSESAEYREGIRSPALPEFIMSWGAVKWGMEKIVNERCWHLINSVEQYAPWSLEIYTFARFVAEEYTDEDLSRRIVVKPRGRGRGG